LTFDFREAALALPLFLAVGDRAGEGRTRNNRWSITQYISFAALSLSENQQPLITQYEIINLPYHFSTTKRNLGFRVTCPSAFTQKQNG
jgi:hypothetical protein